MAKTVVGLFDDYQQAQMAVQQLRNAGISDSDLSLVAHDSAAQVASGDTITTHDTADSAATGAGTGATVGAVAGGAAGLLAGIGAIVIPGFGPVVAAGWFISTLTGAGIGAVAGAAIGGLAGALTAVGVPEDEAGYYAEGVRRGGALVTIRAEDAMAERAASILDSAGAIDIERRGEYYRSTGYAGYNADAQPYNTDEITRERTAYQTYQGATGGISAAPINTGQSNRMARPFDNYANDFRFHYQTTYPSQSGRYEDYEPAYRYGYDLADNARYQGQNWTNMESDIQRDWDTRYPNTWDRMKDSIRYAWERATGDTTPGIQTGGRAIDGTPDTRGITEKAADAVTGDRIDDKTGKVVR